MGSSLFDISPLEPLIRDGFILLTPNQRLARRIKIEWDQRQAGIGAGTWPQLPVYPVDQWLQESWRGAVARGQLPPRLLLGTGQAQQLWRQVIEDEMRDGPYRLLRPEDAAEIAAQGRDILYRWRVDWSDESIRAEFERDPDCRVFLGWLEAFEQRLQAAGQATAVDCLQDLLQLQTAPVTPGVVLVECDELPPLQQAALARLAGTVRTAPVADHVANRLLHPFADRREELQAVAAWAAATSRRAPQDTLAIVLGDAPADLVALGYLLRREFGCLGDDYDSLPVNFSTGIPLAHAPLARDALAVLSLGLRRVGVPQVGAIMRSRFVDLPDAGSALAQRFLQRLCDRGRENLEVAELRYQASETHLGSQRGLLLGKYLLDMYRMPELKQRAMPSEWAASFSRVLDLWGWPGNGLDSLEYQQAELWSRTLEDFRGFDAVCGRLDYAGALRLLRDSCERQVSHPQTVDAGIHVLGPLEAAGLSFDHLWLVGMQASAWPAPARPNPFLPVSLQARFNTPHATAEREWSFAQARLAQYLRCSGTVHTSYSRQLDGVPDLPSPLLQQFAEQAPEAVPALSEHWIERREQGELALEADAVGPPVLPGEDAIGGSGLFEDQSHCPFRAFSRRRLRVEPLGEFQVALSAADRGNLLHTALNALWAELHDYAGLMALDSRSETAAIERAVETAVQAERGQLGFNPGPAFWQLEQERLAGLLAQWLAVERARSDFVVAAREEEIFLELSQMRFRLRVDRVDELPDGSRVIIDYKSSVSRVTDWMGERPRKPQLLLYGIAEPEESAALAFAQVRPNECRFVGLGRTDGVPGIRTDLAAAEKAGMDAPDWATLNERWRENLERLAAEFVQGRAEVDPLSTDSCQWCGLQSLCRVDRDDTPMENRP